MQLASAKALTSLCVSAQKARPHSVSIASYISSPDQVRPPPDSLNLHLFEFRDLEIIVLLELSYLLLSVIFWLKIEYG